MMKKSKIVVAVVLLLFLAALVGVLQLSAMEGEPNAGSDFQLYIAYGEEEQKETYKAQAQKNVDVDAYEEFGYCAAPEDDGRELSLQRQIEQLEQTLRAVKEEKDAVIARIREEKEELVARGADEHAAGLACHEGDGNGVWESVAGHQRVLFPSFPASGGPELMSALSYMLDGPVCSVYPEKEGKRWNAELGIEDGNIVECRCEAADCLVFNGAAAPISTYFPTITQQVAIPTVDKVLVVVRNPVDNIEAFWRMCQETSWLASRRRAWKWHFEKELGEYKKFHDFWDRYADTVGAMYMAVKYEDLCSKPLPTLGMIFSFLDVPKHRINWAKAAQLQMTDFCYSFDERERGATKYTEGQGAKVQSVLANILEKYNYGELMAEYSRYWVGVPDE